MIEATEHTAEAIVAIKVSDAMKTMARLIVFMLLLISICSRMPSYSNCLHWSSKVVSFEQDIQFSVISH